jgi:hypothetical protein
MRFFAPDLMHNRKNTTTIVILLLYLVACPQGFPPDWPLESTFPIYLEQPVTGGKATSG